MYKRIKKAAQQREREGRPRRNNNRFNNLFVEDIQDEMAEPEEEKLFPHVDSAWLMQCEVIFKARYNK